eukprot:3891344-Amphidinium_carterae.2
MWKPLLTWSMPGECCQAYFNDTDTARWSVDGTVTWSFSSQANGATWGFGGGQNAIRNCQPEMIGVWFSRMQK